MNDTHAKLRSRFEATPVVAGESLSPAPAPFGTFGQIRPRPPAPLRAKP